jgi:hypothetical protein
VRTRLIEWLISFFDCGYSFLGRFFLRKFADRLFAAVCLISLAAVAQQTQPTTNPPSPDTQQQAPPAKPAPSTEQQKAGQEQKPGEAGTSNDRLFYALPNFLTLETKKQLPPLTVKQKFAVVARGSFDYIQYPWYGFLSLVSQAENSEPGYGQGWEGYGKRYGAAFADGTIENFFTGAILPSVLHQDPRYYQMGQGSFWHRTGYAVSRNLITLRDQGGHQFNYSEVVGGALSAAISTYTYHPKSFFTYRYNSTTGTTTAIFHPSDRTFSNTAKVWGTQYGYDTLTLVIKEFWPDIRRKIAHKHKAEPVAPANPQH